jgi:5-methyltetrahydrofolate corrinoid/iron sulfur protein methyltransferase
LLIIGEKINGAIPSAAKAIENRDEEFIRHLVDIQVEAGADYLDICAGSTPEEEEEILTWLVDLVQDQTEVPICLDSPDSCLLRKLLPKIKSPGIINSVSGEGDKCDVLYPFLKENKEWKVIALTCDNSGVPDQADKKISVAVDLIEKAKSYDIPLDHIYIDPLVLSLSAVNDSMLNFMEAIRGIHKLYPEVHYTSGLSNISFGMPYRKMINQNFLTLALSAGMDSAIIDPTNRDVYATMLSAEALLARDKNCRKYNKAYRAGKIGPVKN